MKFSVLSALLFVTFIFSSTVSAIDKSSLCLVCGGMLTIPKDWETAQTYLKMGCGMLNSASSACVSLVDATDLTSSYPNMYPYILQIKDYGCKAYCN